MSISCKVCKSELTDENICDCESSSCHCDEEGCSCNVAVCNCDDEGCQCEGDCNPDDLHCKNCHDNASQD